MKKKKISSRVIGFAAIVSAISICIESGIYYREYIKQFPFYIALILENCVHVFTNDADISIQTAVNALSADAGIFLMLLCVFYCMAVLTAPVCTLAVIYRFFQTLFRGNFYLFHSKKKEQILIFGYNENVRALLKREVAEPNINKRSIRVISNAQLSENDEKLFFACKAIHYEMDCFDEDETEILDFLKGTKIKEAKHIILYEESSGKNFELLHTLISNKILDGTVKIYCNCEESEIHDIIEIYYNNCEEKPDLEIFSVNELRVNKLYTEHPIHEVYLNSKKSPKEWHMHMLIIGFGKLGQRMLLQAMNQGVVHSENDLIFDVVDSNMDEQKQIFANHFSGHYVIMNENEWVIPNRIDSNGENPHADGVFKIRFHSMDIRFKNFQNTLSEICKDLPPTYAAICITDEKNSMHCMLELERYLHRNGISSIPIGMRMESNSRMGKFIEESNIAKNKVFIIEEVKHIISIQDMISEQLNKEAKQYHYVYSKLSVEKNTSGEEKTASNDGKVNIFTRTNQKNIENEWKKLKLFKRMSSKASSSHAVILEDVVKYQQQYLQEMLEKYFGKNGIFHENGDKWEYNCTEEELVEQMNADPFFKEMLMLEHRRWNYFMASLGWRAKEELPEDAKRYQDIIYEDELKKHQKIIFKKNEEKKINPCMVDWQELCTTDVLQSYCKYDILPLLFYLYKKNQI